jgi:all-trans-retinol dehydrogenase (NAD+)
MGRIAGKTALITGGAQGMGRAVAELLLQKGARQVILWDIQQELLEKTAAALRAKGQAVVTDIVDVSRTEDLIAAASRAEAAGPVDILINNAGIIVGKEFVNHTHEDIDRSLAINTTALMHLTREILPGMMARGRGHIVNIASAAGMVANPKMSAYCASKWAVIGWSDTLRLEMERGRTGVKVTTVTPYYVNTGMFAGVRSPFLPLVKTEKAARAIVRGIERDSIWVRMPALIYTLPLLRGLLPTRLFDLVVGDGLRVYRTMDEFKGRDEFKGQEK